MVAGSVLPVTIYKCKLYFLFGKENTLEDSSKGWSDFGGGLEKGETPYITAMREGSEELTGFLGDATTLDKYIKKNGGVHLFSHNDYNIHMFFLEYDENLVKYYNYNHKFIWDRLDNKMLNGSKIFEKIEIGWFSTNDIKKRLKEFRGFYQEIIMKVLEQEENIRRFITNKNRKTKKNRQHL